MKVPLAKQELCFNGILFNIHHVFCYVHADMGQGIHISWHLKWEAIWNLLFTFALSLKSSSRFFAQCAMRQSSHNSSSHPPVSCLMGIFKLQDCHHLKPTWLPHLRTLNWHCVRPLAAPHTRLLRSSWLFPASHLVATSPTQLYALCCLPLTFSVVRIVSCYESILKTVGAILSRLSGHGLHVCSSSTPFCSPTYVHVMHTVSPTMSTSASAYISSASAYPHIPSMVDKFKFNQHTMASILPYTLVMNEQAR